MTIRRSDNTLVWWQAFMAALSYVGAATTLSDFLPGKWAVGFIILVGALNTGTAVYVGNSPMFKPPRKGRPKRPIPPGASQPGTL
jgi:hypothetical protein